MSNLEIFLIALIPLFFIINFGLANAFWKNEYPNTFGKDAPNSAIYRYCDKRYFSNGVQSSWSLRNYHYIFSDTKES